ncbi:hypothetical protein HOLleu_00719 [Holothuria leucospilota]|uniref:Uncharacterized protein n=1 Tax=Holothuria leucospilota TaxID=206669 RepID=A0A9Q1CP07_HOLLE|nr:hypothetical protein HOLleu_00719 [Holothuria leucospilota]
MEVPSTAKNRPKPIKCLVYWLEENLVSIVSKSAVDIPVGKSLEQGSIYLVRYSGKKYSAKVLKISATESADDDEEPPAPAKKKHRGSTSKQKLEKQLSAITEEAQYYKCSLVEDEKAALVKEVAVLKMKIQGLEKEVEDLKEANEDLKKMVELVNGSGVYVYPGQKTVIESAGTAGQCLSYLVATFFTREELGRSNLTGKNGKDALDGEVLKAIIVYISQTYFFEKGIIKLQESLRRKAQGAYNNLVQELSLEEQMLQRYFRLKREEFTQLLFILRDDITKFHVSKEVLCPRQRLAICLSEKGGGAIEYAHCLSQDWQIHGFDVPDARKPQLKKLAYAFHEDSYRFANVSVEHLLLQGNFRLMSSTDAAIVDLIC